MNSTLSTTSPYITITDNTGYFGTILIDSTKENISDPYVVSVSASTPHGHNAEFRLITTQGSFVDTFFFNLVVGTYHYLVWNPDRTPTSGQTIHSLLTSLGYSGLHSTTLPVTDLNMYRAILVCVGIYPNNYIIGASSQEATALVNYLNSGGRLYIEGGDVWYYDPMVGGYNFCSLFGISATADGSSDMGPVQGQPGTFTNQMYFSYSGENSYMDHISPSGTGAFLIFKDADNLYDCGVARDAGIYRTVGVSFELGSLVDGSGVSTRRALLDSILHFFGIYLVSVEENKQEGPKQISLQVSPNPFRNKLDIRYTIHDTGLDEKALLIIDVSGRVVKSFNPVSSIQNQVSSILWDGTDELGRRLPAGVYFVHLETDNQKYIEKVIKIE
ncbi:MAG: T9SS type A sorting domain-containing protein [candidate division WOR-3 bacterium]|nr:T9SS type A sorting domain-containing protein [candidate division WOR-3 bacterium]